MSEDVREIIYTAANLIFLGAVLFIGMMFFNLRSDYARIITEREVSEWRIVDTNRYGSYDLKEVTGYEVMNAITSYACDIPIYVTGAYEPLTKNVFINRLYDKYARLNNPSWFQLSKLADPLTDSESIQSWYRADTTYYAILCYDAETPEQLAKDIGLTLSAGRKLSTATHWRAATDNMAKIAQLNTKYRELHPNDLFGNQVTGILFVCLDVRGIDEVTYDKICIH